MVQSILDKYRLSSNYGATPSSDYLLGSANNANPMVPKSKPQNLGLLNLSSNSNPMMGLLGNPLFAIGTALLNPRQSFGQNLQQGFQNLMQQQMYKQEQERKNRADMLQLLTLQNQLKPKPVGSPIKVPGKDNQVDFVQQYSDGTMRNLGPAFVSPTSFEQKKQFVLGDMTDKEISEMSVKERADIFKSSPKVEVNTSDKTAVAKEVRSIKNDFRKDKLIVDATERINKFKEMESYVANPSPFGDIALIFAFYKAIDPTSVVREGEFQVAENAKPLALKLKSTLQKVKTGERLLPQERERLLEVSRNIVEAQRAAVNRKVASYRSDLNFLNLPEGSSNVEIENPFIVFDKGLDKDTLGSLQNQTRSDINVFTGSGNQNSGTSANDKIKKLFGMD